MASHFAIGDITIMAIQFVASLVKEMNEGAVPGPIAPLLRIRHPSVTTVQLICNTESLTRSDGIWQPFPFRVNLLSVGSGQIPVMPVVVENVDQAVTRFMRETDNSNGLAQCDHYWVDIRQPNVNMIEIEDWYVQNLKGNLREISFDLSPYKSLDTAYAKYSFTPSRFPGIF